MAVPTGLARRIPRPVIFVCDVQEKFRSAIHEFSHVLSTTTKLLKAAEHLSIPVLATTQLRAKLGPTCPELNLDAHPQLLVHSDKSRFSMWTTEVQAALAAHDALTPVEERGTPFAVAIVGIESHICVTQTTLDLLAAGHKVYILADGVSSCNPQEVPIAMARLRQAGAIVTTSESWLYEVMGDAAIPEFRSMAGLVKESTAVTKAATGALCRI